ncbi:hypothetical protein PT285_04870 [Lactobacillus sp. ESL0791]|uniref:GH39 family glycosyl hydrolase n=1 Tax=Lactobacillus sp. ESL0791 TaxID=2983234 RepID=UPI0023F8CABA|nr:cellulase family glycosylhydrolase [Lactobacillus sp. ESL0791]MDF7638728.1 hypothetical protein [Lactobacillus sp. ESL0791]
MVNFKINSNVQTKFSHYWELCVGSSHAYTALRADYRQQLKKVHDELGFKYVRFHGIFDDEMSVCTEIFDFGGKSHGIVYNFSNIDNIIDFLLKIGMKPFLELGFMPSCIASDKGKIFPYGGNNSMPKSDEEWIDLIAKFTDHIVTRYGEKEVESWFFEVWNEPNLPLFFSGTQKDYFHLYEITVKTIKETDSKLKVGGPATSFNAWISKMVNFCEKNDVPLDFISTHHYPTDDPLWKSGMGITDFFKNNFDNDMTYHRGILREMAQKVKQEAKNYPVYYTEWNVSAFIGDVLHDEPYAAAMVAKTLADNDGLVDGYSFWTFSDIFEEQYQKPSVFHGGFGLQTYQGIEKPVYRIFEIFHHLGDTRLAVISYNSGATAELLAIKKGSNLQLLAYNHNVPNEKIEKQRILIDVAKPNLTTDCSLLRIDEDHANAKKYWQKLGEPTYVTETQAKNLHCASELKQETLKILNGKIELEMPIHSCAFVTIENYFA